MRLVTYNLYKGGNPDYSAWSRVFEAFDPDIVLLQESSAPQHYAPQLPPDVQQRLAEGTAWTRAGTNYWGSGVWVRRGHVTVLPIDSAYMGWMTAVEVTGFEHATIPDRFRIVSLHTPTPRGGTYVTEVQRMLDVIAALGNDVPLIIGGDFNLTVGVRQPNEPLQNHDGELAVLQRLEQDFGLLNCWQAANPNQPLAQTLRWRFSEESKPYHCDGLFVPMAWRSRLASCVAHTTETWHGRSDHYPVVATFVD